MHSEDSWVERLVRLDCTTEAVKSIQFQEIVSGSDFKLFEKARKAHLHLLVLFREQRLDADVCHEGLFQRGCTVSLLRCSEYSRRCCLNPCSMHWPVAYEKLAEDFMNKRSKRVSEASILSEGIICPRDSTLSTKFSAFLINYLLAGRNAI